MPFFINHPEFRGYGDVVFEGEIVVGHFGRPTVKVITESIAYRWPTINPRYLCETDGPTRRVSDEEYQRLTLREIEPHINPIERVQAVAAERSAEYLKENKRVLSDAQIGDSVRDLLKMFP
jgi:hypothetical protein